MVDESILDTLEYPDNRLNSDGRKILSWLPYDTIVGSNVKISINVTIAAGVIIGDNVIIKEGVKIGKNTVLHNNVTIGNKTRIGSNCVIYKHSIIRQSVYVGKNSIIGDGSYIYKESDPANKRNVIIRRGCRIGARVIISGDTIIESGSVIGSNVVIMCDSYIGKMVDGSPAGFAYIGGWSVLYPTSTVPGNCKLGYCTSFAGDAVIEPSTNPITENELSKMGIHKKILYKLLFTISRIRYTLTGK